MADNLDLAEAREVESRMTPGEWRVGDYTHEPEGRNRLFSDAAECTFGADLIDDDQVGTAYMRNHWLALLDRLELAERLNEDKFRHLEAYRKAASEDKGRIATLEAERDAAREQLAAARADQERLDFIAYYLRVEPFEIPTGQGDADVGWRFIRFHMDAPRERVVYEHYRDNLREAITAAIAAGKEKGNGAT